ncbi:MAG: serine--tRNA ligase [Porphyromonas sp.]|nr:serine--tRNA ligase [Bacteroidales bacterium]MDY3099762.1 serine--tRNA ligase [Porphyromonas sp.]
MLTIKYLSEHTEEAIRRLAIKNVDARESIEKILALSEERRNYQRDLDELLATQNRLSKEIGALMKGGKKAEGEAKRNEVNALKEESKTLEQKKNEAEEQMNALLVLLPNTPSETVPKGKSAEDNVIERTGGVMPDLPSDHKKPHWELAKEYDLIDFELGVKITGAGFPVYKGYGARLQRALIDFFLDNAREAGYLEIQPPYVVNEDSGFGTGQLPDKEGQMYHVGIDNLYLIPTAEVPVTNIFRDIIVDEKDFPIKLTAYSACFRREAGSYGKDVRGLNRLHQFDKVEIVRIDSPEHSYESLDEMVRYVETLVQKLELPYRIVRLSGGDISFTSALTFDFEVFSGAQERWLEVSSVSNFESFQANRLKCRYRTEGHTELCHTLNGSALALPRIVAALLENNQTEDGIVIPAALRPYTRFDLIPRP